ncbi:MAG: endonuclease/exonuclease/phosphatase family protein, partial [Deltaproteobacteria bacterium]|nr:endonuclease/exonuclease/phosphatase family protein [Deltaproteobacteria bacterium]
MRILSWNLNHRAARQRIPVWIADAIAAQAPDVLALNEYVDGRDKATCRADHERFLDALDATGLTHRQVTTRVGRSNQVLVAAREPIEAGSLVAADDISDSLPPNFLHVRLVETGLDLVAFRMPAYEYVNRHKKRLTWDWLIDALGGVRQRPAVLIGDMNTQPDDSERYCGDSVEKLVESGWRLALPSTGYSWRRREGSPERRID